MKIRKNKFERTGDHLDVDAKVERPANGLSTVVPRGIEERQ